MKTHRMKLLKEPYEEIKSGRKNVEMRLYDEKRREIAVGDLIVFSLESFDKEEICAKVTDTYIYEDFHSLAENFDPESLGFAGKDPEYISNYMGKIYGVEEIEKYGTVAIKIVLCK